MNCVYMVYYSPPGCGYQIGELVYLDCDPPCADIMISTGACAGAYLMAMGCDCS